MLDQAKQYPMVMAVLSLMQLLDIVLMLRDAKKLKCLELLITVACMSIALYACTNAPRYLRIGVELVAWYKTASEACKQLAENFVFYHETGNGKPIFVDRAHEIVNHYFGN
jgi:hypothetical protein